MTLSPLDISAYHNGSFDGVPFFQCDGADLVAAPDREIVLAEHKILGGDRTIVQRMGIGPGTLKIRVLASTANMASLYDKVKESHTLVYAGGTVTARLTDLGERTRPATYDVEEAVLTFLVP